MSSRPPASHRSPRGHGSSRSSATRPARGAPITVVLAAGHARWVARARLQLEAQENVQVVAEAQDVPGAVAAVTAHRPTVVLLDQRIFPGGAARVLPVFRQASPRSRVLMVTPSAADAFVLDVVRRGGHGVLWEDALHTHLIKAIGCLAAGQAWLTRGQEAQVLASLWELTAAGGSRAG